MFFKKKQRFSIRKFTIGTCSVLLGTVFVAGVDKVAAEEVTPSEVVSSAPELGGDQTSETTVTDRASGIADALVTPVTEEVASTERQFAVQNKVRVLDVANLSEAEKAAVVATVRSDNNLAEGFKVLVASDGSVTVLENDALVGRLTSAEVIESHVAEVIPVTAGGETSVTDTENANRPKAPSREAAFPNQGQPFSTLGTSALRATAQNGAEEGAPEWKTDYSVKAVNDADPKDPEPNRYTTAILGLRATQGDTEHPVKFTYSVDATDPKSEDGKPAKVYITAFKDGQVVRKASLDLSDSTTVVPMTIDNFTVNFKVGEHGIISSSGNEQEYLVGRTYSVNSSAETVWGAEAESAVATWLPQPTHYLDIDTGESIHPSYKQYGWRGYDYTTVPIVIEGYDYVETKGNPSGDIDPTRDFTKGSVEYLRNPASGPKGIREIDENGKESNTITVYRKLTYLDNDGTVEVEAYILPYSIESELKKQKKAAEALTDASAKAAALAAVAEAEKKAEAEYFFTHLEEFPIEENKLYDPQNVSDADLAARPELADLITKDKTHYLRARFEDKERSLSAGDFAVEKYADLPDKQVLKVGERMRISVPILRAKDNTTNNILSTSERNIALSNSWKIGSAVRYYYRAK
ncbi:YSIRK-type signal peptide-containing protein, partial [Streptococcus sp. ZJ100]